MDARCDCIKKYAFTDVKVYVWTGPEMKGYHLTLVNDVVWGSLSNNKLTALQRLQNRAFEIIQA